MPTLATQTSIDSVLQENRVFECSDAFRADAHIGSSAEYERLYRQAAENPEKFWGEIAGQLHRPQVGEEVLIPAGAVHSVRNIGHTTARWLYGYKRSG